MLIDHFACWCVASSMPDANTEAVARILWDTENLHPDQGKIFESDVSKECSRIWGTHKVRTTLYATTDNGVCERGKKVVGASLKALLLEYDNEQWDRLLAQILSTVRSRPHETTGETAIYMMLGREVRLPDAFHLEVIQADDMDASQYARELQQRLHIAASRMREMQRKIMDATSEEPYVYSVWVKYG